jgi:hypothetical protein
MQVDVDTNPQAGSLEQISEFLRSVDLSDIVVMILAKRVLELK